MDLLWIQAKEIKVWFTYKALDLCAFLMSQSPVRVAVVSSGLCLLISSWKACKRKVSNVIWGYKKMFTSSKCFQRHIIPDLPSIKVRTIFSLWKISRLSMAVQFSQWLFKHKVCGKNGVTNWATWKCQSKRDIVSILHLSPFNSQALTVNSPL